MKGTGVSSNLKIQGEGNSLEFQVDYGARGAGGAAS